MGKKKKKKAPYGIVGESTTPAIVVHPGRMFGKPTIGNSRLTAELIADIYWQYGKGEVKRMWDYMTDVDILVCCWYVARYGTRKEKQRWRDWLPIAGEKLWSSDTVKDCPWPPRKDGKDG